MVIKVGANLEGHPWRSHTIHIKPCKIKLCIESHSTGFEWSCTKYKALRTRRSCFKKNRGRLCHDLIDSDHQKTQPHRCPCAVDLINHAHNQSHQRQQISSAASTYLICIWSESKSYSRGSDTTVGFYGRVRRLQIKIFLCAEKPRTCYGRWIIDHYH